MRRHFWHVETWGRIKLVAFMFATILCTIGYNTVLFGYEPDRPWLSVEGCLVLCNWGLAILLMISIYVRWSWQSKKEEILRNIDIGVEEVQRRFDTGEIPITKKEDGHE